MSDCRRSGAAFLATRSDLQWVINAYLLPLSALLLLGGAVGDRFGRRNIWFSGWRLFAAGSALCAAAPSLGFLLAARGLQGAGAAFLLPNSLAILGSVFTGEARGRAVGTWSAASAVAGAIGPVLGGWLIDTAGWRSIFLLNLPAGGGGDRTDVCVFPRVPTRIRGCAARSGGRAARDGNRSPHSPGD